ncbi:replication protein A 70 kDa DNA-binding subunit C-like isoform X1 [Papaver somniferum]|uniref:replication protein A 70 kDa DNA-binding subunit C-like isoform X1 n=1 Tax=Papaver somniferum TaxID=3469 RepID=UPI000E701A56|nr:replication protein A 70 kDa DNA-binding subunit C-like isoform X1 [Papaver somniferum]
MASQVTCNIHKVGPLATQDTLKSLPSLDEGKTSIVTVRVTRKWEELDFMSTNDVTSIDMVIVDEQGEELHAVIPKNLIWKFDKLIREGCLYSMQKLHLTTAKPKFCPAHNEKRAFFRSTTSVSALDAYSVSIIPQKNLQNIHLTDVVGFLKTVTNIQVLQRSGGKLRRMREITIENLRGTTMKIALWGSAANQVGNDPIDCDSVPRPVVVAVCSTFVKNYQANSGRITLSLTNATKVYTDADITEAVEMRERCPYARPPRHIVIPTKQGKLPIHFNSDNRKTISQLLSVKWDPSCQAANVLICNATATHVLIEIGWHYLACHRCSKKVMGDDGDLWCTKCEAKVEMPIAR